MTYVTRWRMLHASRLLRDGRRSLDQIAPMVGYESAAAFSKAFKRQMGVASRRFRDTATPF